MVSEADRALINALQIQPRAGWQTLAGVLGCTPATAARRWQRLQHTGEAWITAAPGPRCAAFVAYLALSCATGRRTSIAAALAEDPAAVTIELTAGSCDLLVEVITPDLDTFSRYLLDRIEQLPHLTGVTVAIATTVLAEASQWRLDALDPRQATDLDPHHGLGRRPQPRQLTELDRRLLLELGNDGRQPWEQLARAAATSPATARRHTERLLSSGEAVLRCDVAVVLVERPITAALWIEAPTAELATVARSLTAMPSIRFVATIAGRHNLLVVASLRAATDAHRLETELARTQPALRVADRTIGLHTVKRMGRILDDRGRAAPASFQWALGQIRHRPTRDHEARNTPRGSCEIAHSYTLMPCLPLGVPVQSAAW